MYRIALALLLAAVAAVPASAQRDFQPDTYRSFLEANADIPADALMRMHPAGAFVDRIAVDPRAATFSSEVRNHFGLTADEEELLGRHGFVVTERRSFESFGNGFLEIYEHDLPVFVSTDAILHAFHMSYDRILMDTERGVLIPRLEALLSSLHNALPELATRYADVPAMQRSLQDVDVYLTVPRTLLSGASPEPVFDESVPVVEDLMALIEAETMADYPLFAENCRRLDFSQFTVRGHYTQEPELARYFQAMIWLGRTEMYLIGPATDTCRPTEADVQRQMIDAMLVAEAADLSGGHELLAAFDEIIQLFVGAPDNVTLPDLVWLRENTGLAAASDLLDADRFRAVQASLGEQPWAAQQILSQILVNGTVTEPNRIQPASAFMLLGQRFVIDSYVTGSVVYDKIAHEGVAVRRMLPSTLDVLFALGNDGAAQLLEDDLSRFHYADILAALRYLVDAYDDAFWMQSLYNGWLETIRTLNPPEESTRAELPDFMQTAAWWQQKMNTQLAAWAQLRHDNLLYAKQSYTGVPGCSFPFSYVEPIPAFYETMAQLSRTASDRFQALRGIEGISVDALQQHFAHAAAVNDTLAGIAHKELARTPLSAAETTFLQRMLFKEIMGCYEEINGWYPRLFYGEPGRAREPDLVVADVHTAPADENGTYVGWVLHAGTGPLDLAVVIAEVEGTGPITFVGPVMSYYEHLTTNFERLTDEAWKSAYAAAHRPAFVNLYLADRDGAARATSASLIMTSDEEMPETAAPPERFDLQAYPNPFNDAAALSFRISTVTAHQTVRLDVYDVQGRLVRRLLDQPLSPGNYTVRWDGKGENGAPSASGTYFCRLTTGERSETTAMTYVR